MTGFLGLFTQGESRQLAEGGAFRMDSRSGRPRRVLAPPNPVLVGVVLNRSGRSAGIKDRIDRMGRLDARIGPDVGSQAFSEHGPDMDTYDYLQSTLALPVNAIAYSVSEKLVEL